MNNFQVHTKEVDNSIYLVLSGQSGKTLAHCIYEKGLVFDLTILSKKKYRKSIIINYIINFLNDTGNTVEKIELIGLGQSSLKDYLRSK